MAFIVFNTTGYHSTMAARSGQQYLGSLSSRGGVDSDDWLISPLLSGDAQDITFYVSSETTSYGNEKFQVLTSTGSLETTDFNLIYSNDKVPAQEWARHTCTLPEGTLRFAIRSYATNLMFRVDDVTFIPALPELRLLGYNVYRDGERITAQPVTEPTLTDRPDADGLHSYVVTAVYDKGESRPSDSASADFSALSTPGASDLLVSVDGTTIFCDASFEVYDLAGRLAASARGSVTLAPGIYIVKTADATAKVLLR
jgi:putative fibronectin type III domain protein